MTFNEAFKVNSDFQIEYKGQDYNFSLLNEIYQKMQLSFERFNPKPGEFLIFKNLNHPSHLLILLLCEKYKLVFVPVYEGSNIAEFNTQKEKIKPEFSVTITQEMGGLDFLFEIKRNDYNNSNQISARSKKKMHGCLFQTSGTTGEPGYIFQSFENLILNAITAADDQKITATSKILSILPFSHVGGLCMQTTAALLKGATLQIADRSNYKEVLQKLHNCTHSILVPSFFITLSKLNEFSSIKFVNSPLIVTGSTPVSFKIANAMAMKGFKVFLVYGLTEVGPYVCKLQFSEAQIHLFNSSALPIGKPLENYKFEICETSNEFLVSGPCMGLKYDFNSMTFFSLVDQNGFLHTGDMGLKTEDMFFISGRLKTQISVGGLKFSPHEIEEIILQHPKVTTCAVTGIPHPSLGEVTKAYVVSSAGPETHTELRHEIFELLRQSLSRHKVPRIVEFVNSLPSTSIGKKNLAIIKKIYDS